MYLDEFFSRSLSRITNNTVRSRAHALSSLHLPIVFDKPTGNREIRGEIDYPELQIVKNSQSLPSMIIAMLTSDVSIYDRYY
jgi:hypothetical protein